MNATDSLYRGKGPILDIEPVNGKTEEDRLRERNAILVGQNQDDRSYIKELEEELAQQKDRFQDLLDAVRAVADDAEKEGE